MNMKTLIAAILGLSLMSAPALAMEDDRLFHYFSLETDYADWGEAEREVTFEGEGWLGNDTHRAWLKTEGEWEDGSWHEAEIQLLYSKPIADFWDVQAGVRHDFKPHPTHYAVLGVQGLAPYFFETEAAFFLSDEGDSSFRAEVSYDLLITQRLIAEPYGEANFYFQDVDEQEKASGLTDIDAGLQLRYEITRKFAPYLDFNYRSTFSGTRDIAECAGEDPESFVVRAGLRFWLN